MGTAKSDDDAEERSTHPLAQNRPGVYVQVVGTPRRRKGRERNRLDADGAVSGAPSQPPVPSAPEPASSDGRASGVEPAVRVDAPAARVASAPEPAPRWDRVLESDAPPAIDPIAVPEADSENTNHRADLMKVPAAPRMPSISLSGAPLPAKHPGASLLDAPGSMRPDSIPTQKRTSWALLASVAALSAIITAAAVVAVRESGASDEAASEAAASAPRRAEPRAQPALEAPAAAVAAPNAEAAPNAAPEVPAPTAAAPAAADPTAAAPAPAVAEPAPAVTAPAAAVPTPAVPAPATAVRTAAAPAPSAAAALAPAAVAPAAAGVEEATPVAAPAPDVAAGSAPVRRQPSAPRAPAPKLTPAQIFAKHAGKLRPVELPAIKDNTTLPSNPYEPPAEQ